ncbi:MAG: EamA family transporter [Sphingobacterium sp.]
MYKTKGTVAVLIGAASFGILSTFVKKAYQQGYSLGEVTGAQAIIGLLLLWTAWGVVSSFKAADPRPTKFPTPKYKIILSGISTGAVSILYYKSIEILPASLAIILLMQYIWIGQIIELLFFKVKPQLSQVLTIVLVLAGTVLATGALEHPISYFPLTGIVYGVLAATAYSVFIIVNGRVGNEYPALQKSALMITGAFLLIFVTLRPWSLLEIGIFMDILPYGMPLAIFGTVLPPLLFAYGMPRTGYSLGAVLSTVELPVAVFMSYLILQESVSGIKWIGVVLILATIVWKNKASKRL